jgi:hypothetical protein
MSTSSRRMGRKLLVLTATAATVLFACTRDLNDHTQPAASGKIDKRPPAYHIQQSEKLVIPEAIELPANYPDGNSRVETYCPGSFSGYLSVPRLTCSITIIKRLECTAPDHSGRCTAVQIQFLHSISFLREQLRLLMPAASTGFCSRLRMVPHLPVFSPTLITSSVLPQPVGKHLHCHPSLSPIRPVFIILPFTGSAKRTRYKTTDPIGHE